MKLKDIRIYGSFLILLVAGSMLFMSSCGTSGNDHLGPVITGVRDIHPDSGAVTKIGPGQTIVVQGQNLITTQHVDFAGYTASINQTLYTDTTVIVTIPSDLPFTEIKPDSMNMIHLVTKFGETTYKFPVLPPPPVINGVSNEFATPGTRITLTGSYLYLVKSITFPGNVKATEYASSADGSSLNVTVPAGATQGGEISVATAAGTAVTGPGLLFKDTDHVFLNFDAKNAYTTWNNPADPVIMTPGSPMPTTAYNGGGNAVDTLTPPIPEISAISDNYLLWNVADVPVGSWWVQHLATPTDGGSLAWPGDIPDDASASNLAIKFEVNVPAGVSSGEIKFQIASDDHDYYWKPWDDAGGTFKTNGWQTITIPLTDFPGITQYADVKGQSFNIFYDNGNGSSDVSWVFIGWDNFRIVSTQ